MQMQSIYNRQPVLTSIWTMTQHTISPANTEMLPNRGNQLTFTPTQLKNQTNVWNLVICTWSLFVFLEFVIWNLQNALPVSKA